MSFNRFSSVLMAAKLNHIPITIYFTYHSYIIYLIFCLWSDNVNANNIQYFRSIVYQVIIFADSSKKCNKTFKSDAWRHKPLAFESLCEIIYISALVAFVTIPPILAHANGPLVHTNSLFNLWWRTLRNYLNGGWVKPFIVSLVM